jgi:hypothetical protein
MKVIDSSDPGKIQFSLIIFDTFEICNSKPNMSIGLLEKSPSTNPNPNPAVPLNFGDPKVATP